MKTLDTVERNVNFAYKRGILCEKFWWKSQLGARNGYSVRKVEVVAVIWCTKRVFYEKSLGCRGIMARERAISCEKLWIKRKKNTLQTKKPPSGGPRSAS